MWANVLLLLPLQMFDKSQVDKISTCILFFHCKNNTLSIVFWGDSQSAYLCIVNVDGIFV